MAYNTAITFPPKSHTHSEYAPTNHSHNYMPANPSNIELYAEIPYIDFHYKSSSTDYNARIAAYDDQNLSVQCPGTLFVNNKRISTEDHNHNYFTLERTSENYDIDITKHGPGTWSLRERALESPNAPNSNWYFNLSCNSPDPNFAGQLALGMTTTNCYYRTKGGAWNQIAYADWKTYSKNPNPVMAANGASDGYWLMHSPSQHIAIVTAWCERTGYVNSNITLPISINNDINFPIWCLSYCYGTDGLRGNMFGIAKAYTHSNNSIMCCSFYASGSDNYHLRRTSAPSAGVGNDFENIMYYVNVALPTP